MSEGEPHRHRLPDQDAESVRESLQMDTASSQVVESLDHLLETGQALRVRPVGEGRGSERRTVLGRPAPKPTGNVGEIPSSEPPFRAQ